MKNKFLFPLLALSFVPLFGAQSISDKKRSLIPRETELQMPIQDQLDLVNETLWERRLYLKMLYNKIADLYARKADPETYRKLLSEINHVKDEILETDREWKEQTAPLSSSESYALWHQPEVTLLQLIMDYGAQDYVYHVPPEIGAIRISLNSNLPIPRESWEEMLSLILAQNGIGIRDLNPYLRELFWLRQDLTHLKCITNQVDQLTTLSDHARICFVLAPENSDPRGILQFLQKFSNPAQTTLQLIGSEIFIVSSTDSIKELLKLYDFVKTGSYRQDYQLVTLTKIDPQEMEQILKSAFLLSSDSNGKRPDEEGISLQVLPLSNLTQSLFLFGTKDEVSKAQKMIHDVEAQIEDPKEKTVFWYTAKHSDAEELANVLAKVYDLLVGQPFAEGREISKAIQKVSSEKENSALIVQPKAVEPGKAKEHRTADGQNNFIVDPKTGAIIMVVEQKALPKIKELLKRLDVPKKMVQIEVLLFEKKVTHQNNFGLNLLRLGSSVAQNAKSLGLAWTSPVPGAGILEFLISRKKESGIPAYDLSYNFLLSQEDVQINASPSIVTLNQTPATIAIVEEISINTGSEYDKKEKGVLKNTFSRAQYGITIQITPTINVGETDGETERETGFVTLETDITFDTTKKPNDRPDVTRRHIKNQVRIADGQTVILGGLRRKNIDDHKDSIPFLGEIPGIGKLFSSTGLSDSNSEMFLFITPKILFDPTEDAEKIKYEQLKKRPGDLPEFLCELVEARKREKQRFFEGTLTVLFGRSEKSDRMTAGEYDGR